MGLAQKLASLLNSAGLIPPGKIAGGPSFSAYLGGALAVSSGSWTKVLCTVEEFDTASAFDNVSCRFTPQVPGYYQLTGKVLGVASTASSNMACAIYKNGALAKQGATFLSPGGVQSMSQSVSALVYLNGTTDYVELWAQAAGTGTVQFSAGQTQTFFQGSLVSPAS